MTQFISYLGILIICLSSISLASPIKRSLNYTDLHQWESANLAHAFQHYYHTYVQPNQTAFPVSFITDITALNKTDNTAIRSFIMRYFKPIVITDISYPPLITGYHIYQADASTTRSAVFNAPIYTHPKTKNINHRYSHHDILRGALSGKNLELAWLKTPLDVYLLMMQGSGILRFNDGTTQAIGYAGSNGYPYQSISQYMIDINLITESQRNGPFIKTFLSSNPQLASDILIQNPSYVYFTMLPSMVFKGAAGTPLKAMISAAIDHSFYPWGSLLWIQDSLPSRLSPSSLPTQLIIAQDRGGAIQGPQRADIFFGVHPNAEYAAGMLKDSNNTLILLEPLF